MKVLTNRTAVVLDEHDTVIYSQLVSEIAQEPDYNVEFAALETPNSSAL